MFFSKKTQIAAVMLAAAVLPAGVRGGMSGAGISLLADFRFSEKDGRPVVEDAGPFGFKGSAADGISVRRDAVKGSVLSFPAGNARRVELGKGEAFDRLTHDFTVELSIKPAFSPDGRPAIVMTKRPGWWTARPFAIGVRGDGVLEAQVSDGRDKWIHGQRLDFGKWNHVVLSVSGNEAVLYRNGAREAAVKFSGKLVSNNEPIALGWEQGGNFPGGNVRGFEGEMTGPKFYAGAVTDAQAAEMFSSGLKVRAAGVSDFPSRGLPESLIPEEVRAAPAADAPLEIGIDFSSGEPKAVGMWFDSVGFNSGKTDPGGEPCFAAKQGSALNPWERSAKFVITDPRFRNGRMPVVDVEIEYMLPAWAGIDVQADTSAGSRQVGGGWQATKWSKMSFRIDDAWFGRRDFGNPESARKSDGYDIRINGSTSDLYIKSIKIKGYDRSSEPDFKRLLKLSDVTAPGDIFWYSPGNTVRLDYAFTNMAERAADIQYRFSWERHDGTKLGNRSGEFSIGGEKNFILPLEFRTDGWPYGVVVVHAEFDRKLPGGGVERHSEREIYTGFVEPGLPGKAGRGEFLYGLDTGLGPAYQSPRVMRWCSELGVDIVRGGIRAEDRNLARFEEAMPLYRAAGVQPLVMMDPPWNEDAGKRAEETRVKAAFLKEAAEKYPEIKYWELGNEPDLPFFYKGPIEAYAEAYEVMAKAVLRGNPDAVVMTGGLCFVGEEGNRRARRLIEVVDPDAVGAWSYHGHGPGARAERGALERMRGAVRAAGKDDPSKPYIETESGMAARTRQQEIVQARTCLQKFVYAQSEGLPLFMWFRLVMSSEDYGNLRGDREPRPVVIAYRNTVKKLRGHKFDGKIELASDGAEAYVFKNAKSGSVRLVCWSDGGGGRYLFKLKDGREPVGGFAAFDIFGNPVEIQKSGGGVFGVELTDAPVIVCWNGGDPELLESILGAEGEPAAGAGSSEFSLVVHNPFDSVISGRIEFDGASGSPVKPDLSGVGDVTVKSGETARIRVPCSDSGSAVAVTWPEEWRVFVDAQANPAEIKAVPEKLVCGGAPEYGVGVRLREDGGIDIAAATGEKYRERRTAWLFAEAYCSEDTEALIGTSADWWLEWFVNGESVFDTLKEGNGGSQGADTHTFSARLRKGRNIFAVRVLSGSMGWSFYAGSPERLRRTAAGLPPHPSVRFVMKAADGKVLGSVNVPVREVIALDRVKSVRPLEYSALRADAPDAILGASSVRNHHEAFPDRSKWYGGESDLSCDVRFYLYGEYLAVDLKVHDSVYEPGKQGDRAVISVSPAGGRPRSVTLWGGGRGTEAGFVCGSGDKVSVSVVREGEWTLYRALVPAAWTGGRLFGAGVKVYDMDGGVLKQEAEWNMDGGRVVRDSLFLVPSK